MAESDLDQKLMLFHGEHPTQDPRSKKEKELASRSAWLSSFITACGNFSVQYNFQSISIALLVMSTVQCTWSDDECREGEQKDWVHSTSSSSVFVGAVLGQLTMGYAGDVFGRNTAMMMTLGLVAVSAFLSAIVPTGNPTQVYITIIIARFFLGIGVGGVYPLAATKAAEDNHNTHTNHDNDHQGDHHGGVNINAAAFAFFWQIPGMMVPWILANIFVRIGVSDEASWRLLLGLGALPAAMVVVCTYLENLTLSEMSDHETDRLRQSGHLRHDEAPVARHKHKRAEVDIWALFKKWDTWKKLIATGGGWFIYDIAYYGVSLFAGEIIQAFSDTDDDNVSSSDAILNVTKQNLIGLSMGVPACLISIYLLRIMSTKNLQIVGFLFIALMFILMAVCFVPLRGKNGDALFAIYCFLLFSLSFGPNLTTYVLPAETYPKNIRATFNGISAACGKVGAFAGVYMFGSIVLVTSYPTVMVICGIISVVGAVISYAYINSDEQRQELLEESSEEGESIY